MEDETEDRFVGEGQGSLSMSRALTLALLGLWLGFTAVIAALYLLLPPCPDHAVYDYIGWIVNRGGTLYVDAADQNWPGQMFIHSLSVALFGAKLWSYRLFELIVIIPLSCFVLFRFLRSAGDKLAAFVVVPIYQAMYVSAGFWMSGQREIVAAPLLVASANALLSRVRGGGLRLLVLQGVLIAGATLIRPTLLIMAPLLTLADLLQTRRTGRSWRRVIADHALVAVSIILPMGIIALLGVPSGALAGWYDVSIRFNLEVYAGGRDPWDITRELLPVVLRQWYWMLAWSGLGAVVLWRRDSLALSFVGMILPATLVSLFVQAKGFGYHLGALYALMAILNASTVAAGLRVLMERRHRPLLSALAVVAVLLPAAGLAKKLWSQLAAQRQVLLGQITMAEMQARYEADSTGTSTVRDMVEVSEYIDATTAKDATVLFWERPCHVYTLAERRSPLFAAAFTLLEDAGPQFSLFPRWQAEFEEIMTERPPEVLLFVRDPEHGGYVGMPAQSGDQPRLSDTLRAHLHEYELEKSVAAIDLYRRIEAPELTDQPD
jgi:hypothetical protein